MLRSCMFVGAVAALAGSAHATLFSFASDINDQAWTFKGNGLSITDGTGPSDPLTLVIDDNNGPLPQLEFSCQFNASITLATVGSLNLGGGQFSHNYKASGSFSFTDMASGATLLSVNFQNALFTSLGQEFAWGSTAALQASGTGGSSVNMTWGGAALPGYGLTPGPLASADFGFDLTALNTNGSIPFNFQNLGVAFAPGSGVPTLPWFSEGSFSASAVPGPGAAGLLAMAGLVAMRRRR